MGNAFRLAGYTIATAGVLIESIGVLSLAFYSVRRRLPISPFSMISIGGGCFFGGILLALGAQCYAG